MDDRMRLQKYIAQCGVASRRHAEQLILEGRVRVNGQTVTQLGTTVAPGDRVECDGRLINPERKLIYIMLNKPSGYVTTVSDPEGRPTVMDLVSGIKERIYPIGRLDYDTTGLLLLTNDGGFAYESTHPGKETTKTYLAEIMGIPDDSALDRLRNGVMLDGRMTSEAQVEVEKRYDKRAVLRLTIHEGRNRQVKRMCEAVGHPVLRLMRIAIGKLKLSQLEPGQWRYLTDKEIKLIRGDKNE